MASPLSSERRVSADGSRGPRGGGSFSRTPSERQSEKRKCRGGRPSPPASGGWIAGWPGECSRPSATRGSPWSCGMARKSAARRGHEGDRPRSPDALETRAAARPPVRRGLCRGPGGGRGRLAKVARTGLPPRTSLATRADFAARSTAGAAAPARTRWPARGRTFTTTTTSATTSTASGSTTKWSTPAATSPRRASRLEQAQRAKMRHICRKVWLRPGETVAEAGCGWGAWPSTWPGITASPSRPTTSPTSRSDARGGGHAPKGSATASSSSRTTTATSKGSSTSLSPWGCWSTSGPTTTRNWAP